MNTQMVEIRDCVLATVPASRAIVAIDGSGKTTFTAALADLIDQRPVIVLHVDDFLNPASVRHARGRRSPEGFYLDSYDYGTLCARALDPLSRHGDGHYRVASFDASSDKAVNAPALAAPDDALVLVEGLFLHRDEVVDRWDLSIFLDVPFAETARRMAHRNGTHPDPDDPSIRRYVEGQRIYFRDARPWERASLVVDNTVFGEPKVITGDRSHAAAAAR